MSAILINHKLPDTRQVAKIGKTLGLPVPHVVGCLSMVWIWFDIHAKSGRLVTRDISDVLAKIDDDLGVPGFCRAMESAGWMVIEPGAVVLPEFEGRQRRSQRTRDLDRERQQRRRRKAKDMVQIPAGVTRDSHDVTPESRVTEPENSTWPDGILNAESADVTRESRGRHAVTSPPSPSPALSPFLPPTPPFIPPLPPTPTPTPRDSAHTSAREELPLRFEPTTDELDAALRFDPWAELERQTRTNRAAVISMAGMVNSGAERFTPESLAESWMAEAARRDLRVFNSRRQESAPKLSATNLRADLTAFINIAKNDPERNNLVLRSGPAPGHHGPIPEPDFDWRTAIGILNGTGVSLEKSRTWDSLHRKMQINLIENGRKALEPVSPQ